MRTLISLAVLLGSVGCCLGAPVTPKVAAVLKDKAELLPPSDVHLDGWLGARVLANATNRLLTIDTEPLLAGYRHRPGSHPWIGEHVGKWLHAATLAWAYTGDDRLRTKLDKVAAELIATQEPNGYLGTYLPGKRFGVYPEADWDVWSHKYNLIGLLTYYEYTGNAAALACCRKMGDLLVQTFGPGKKSILSAGTHRGMAATSVLEPVVLLYRHTGDPRYLDFARYIVKSWDEPGGPGILKTLTTEKKVNKTANGKAYEMLSNLVGLCELARATGDRRFLKPALNAWQDIVSRRLYLTGSASQGEHFHDDFDLPNGAAAHVAETCVTTTWLQLNWQLLRSTGEARFANELEKTVYNHLAAAQRPRGDDWCYFTPLEGKKAYDAGITCCHSSGPRGMALAPLTTYFKTREGKDDYLLVSTFETSSVSAELGGSRVLLKQTSRFPRAGESEVEVQSPGDARFGLKIRAPAWAAPLKLQLNGKSLAADVRDGWVVVPARAWKNGDRIRLGFELKANCIEGEHGNKGLLALEWGPFVLAYDTGVNAGLPAASLLELPPKPEAKLVTNSAGSLRFETEVRSVRFAGSRPATLVTFADAGADGGDYSVWLRSSDRP